MFVQGPNAMFLAVVACQDVQHPQGAGSYSWGIKRRAAPLRLWCAAACALQLCMWIHCAG
jgi:hypothetical protein